MVGHPRLFVIGHRQNRMPEQHPWARIFHDPFDFLSAVSFEAVCKAGATFWLRAVRTLVDSMDRVGQESAAIVAKVARAIVFVATIDSDHLFDD